MSRRRPPPPVAPMGVMSTRADVTTPTSGNSSGIVVCAVDGPSMVFAVVPEAQSQCGLTFFRALASYCTVRTYCTVLYGARRCPADAARPRSKCCNDEHNFERRPLSCGALLWPL